MFFSFHTYALTAGLLHKGKDKQAEGQSADRDCITLHHATPANIAHLITHHAPATLPTTQTPIVNTGNRHDFDPKI